MKPVKVLFTLILVLVSNTSFAQVLTDEEKKLYDLIMEYRNENGLPDIPFSKSLTYVAQTHVKDLYNNRPNNGNCNLHSWSSNGNWTPCCYTPDHAQAKCMWSKPSELTSYKGYGYEIASEKFYSIGFGNEVLSDYSITAGDALDIWKRSPGHNAVILNLGKWNDLHWNAIGIGMFKGFAVVWFGEEYDLE